MDTFYLNMVQRLLVRGEVSCEMSVLVLCGEQMDAEIFDHLGFSDVTVTNLDERHQESWSTGAQWDHQNAEALDYPDRSYDFVVVHLGLHHCRMPHKALCEMYRVSRKGLLVIEPCENWMVRIGRKLGVGQAYEVHAVAAHGLRGGGVNNTPVPNYVYRWTVENIRHTICSFAPEFDHRLYAKSNLVVHWHDLHAKKKKGRLVLMLLLFPVLKLASWFSPQFGNNLGVFVAKAGASDLQTWMKAGDNGEPNLNTEWFKEHITLEQGLERKRAKTEA